MRGNDKFQCKRVTRLRRSRWPFSGRDHGVPLSAVPSETSGGSRVTDRVRAHAADEVLLGTARLMIVSAKPRKNRAAQQHMSKKDSSAEATVDGDASDAPTTASASSSDPSDASSTKSPDESGKSSSQLQQNELLYSTRDAGAVDVDKAVELAMRQKAVADYQATQQSAGAGSFHTGDATRASSRWRD